MSGRRLLDTPPWRVISPPPQGSSLWSGLCCPGPSSLNRPHSPLSQAHRVFATFVTYARCLRCAGRLGDPREVPSFCCSFLPNMPSSSTPGSSVIVLVQYFDADMGLRQAANGSALPIFPPSVSRGATFRGFSGSLLLRPARLLVPLDGSN